MTARPAATGAAPVEERLTNKQAAAPEAASPSADAGGGTMPYMAQLDGLRGAAILLVMLDHFGNVAPLPAGELGVRLFFVLSGFLITGILLGCRRARERSGQSLAFTLRQFYARRTLRIFPVYYLALAVAFWVVGPALRQDAAWHLLYCGNWWTALKLRWPPLIPYLWSLCVEEQFYLLWPLVILLVPRRRMVPTLACVVAIGPVCRAAGWLLWHNVPFGDVRLYVATPSYFDSLGLGALLAVAGDGTSPNAPLRRRLELGGLIGGIALGALIVAVGVISHAMVNRLQQVHLNVVGTQMFRASVWIVFAGTGFSLLGVGVVALAARGVGGAIGALLGSRWLGHVGRVSYGMYVWQGLATLPVELLLDRAHVSLGRPWRLLLMTAASYAAAVASWHAVEKPLNGLKRFFPYAAPARR